MKKLTWTTERHGDTTGFWLPVGRTFVTETDPPFGPYDDQFAIWMEEDFRPDDDYRQFIGSIRFGPLSMHICAYPFVEVGTGADMVWQCDNEAADDFLGAYGDRPTSFEIAGYAGWWVLIAHPFC